jgi:site-specific recombinase XerD
MTGVGIIGKSACCRLCRYRHNRHTFAVHRLTEWYRTGADVQLLLPALSTYLGHVDLHSTQCYLTMTPELLGEANRRFQNYVYGGCHEE